MRVWTDEQITLIKDLRELNVSARKIVNILNNRFGVNFSRSVVISKFRRLGIPMMGKPVSKQAQPRKIIKKKLKMNLELAPELWCTITELTRNRCHWPYGDNPPYMYCGAPTYKETKSSYCSFHRVIVNQQPKEITNAVQSKME